MNRFCWLLPALLLPLALFRFDADAQDKTPGKAPTISWQKIVIDKTFRSEGVAVADVNKDGKLDILVGDCWYEAPKDASGTWKRHILRADRTFNLINYSDAFACFSDDFNGDGYADLIVIPFPGNACYWYENPGATGGKWKQHLLTTSACNETPIYVDLFKTGKKILVMGWNPPKDEQDPKKGNYDDRGEMCYFLPGKDPTQPWQRISISGPPAKGKTIPGTQRFAHGLGQGDVNGDGRNDILCTQGWWEQPEKPDGQPWQFHAARITENCADMHTLDVDGDGKADILSTSAHAYGFWWSQQRDAHSFVQRAFFPPPAEVAKLPVNFEFAAEEKTLLETINKLRSNPFKRAPFKIDPQLCELARLVARQETSSAKKDVDLHKSYAGKIVHQASASSAQLADPKSIEKLALSLLPDNVKQAERVLPGFDIGVGAVRDEKGETRYVLLIGDRGRFSLPSQTHALHFVDIDGDGLKDLVTGRRWWAHGPTGDIGPGDPAYLYWFQAKRGKDGMITFVPHLIDADSGVGTQFAIADMNGDGLPDIVISNKKGVYVFLQVR